MGFDWVQSQDMILLHRHIAKERREFTSTLVGCKRAFCTPARTHAWRIKFGFSSIFRAYVNGGRVVDHAEWSSIADFGQSRAFDWYDILGRSLPLTNSITGHHREIHSRPSSIMGVEEPQHLGCITWVYWEILSPSSGLATYIPKSSIKGTIPANLVITLGP